MKVDPGLIERGTGDCFELSAKHILDMRMVDSGLAARARLVHGRPRLRAEPFIRIVHAWVEIDRDLVIDPAAGVEVPRALYYALGSIKPAKCKRYTAEQVAKMTLLYKHWGPWEIQASKEEEKLSRIIAEG